jgi:hypothetical protein
LIKSPPVRPFEKIITAAAMKGVTAMAAAAKSYCFLRKNAPVEPADAATIAGLSVLIFSLIYRRSKTAVSATGSLVCG